MDYAKLKSKVWVSALIQRCMIEGIFAAVTRKGDAERGAIKVKVALMDGTARVYAQERDTAGVLQWVLPMGSDPVAENQVDQYLARQAGYDEDLWVIELEDRLGRHPMIEATP